MADRAPTVICLSCGLLVVTTVTGTCINHYPQGVSGKQKLCEGSNQTGRVYP